MSVDFLMSLIDLKRSKNTDVIRGALERLITDPIVWNTSKGPHRRLGGLHFPRRRGNERWAVKPCVKKINKQFKKDAFASRMVDAQFFSDLREALLENPEELDPGAYRAWRTAATARV